MRHLKDAMKICTGVGKKKQGKIGMFLFEEGEKIGSFGQSIYHVLTIKIMKVGGCLIERNYEIQKMFLR